MTTRNKCKIFFLLLLICSNFLSAKAQQKPEIHAHRGFRGLMPENTIVAMKNALDYRATVLEMDISFSKDKKVIVSHDPWLNSRFVHIARGNIISKEEQEAYKLYQLNYKEIKKYDIGIKPHPLFPKQKKISAYIPLLSKLIDSVELYAKEKKYSLPRYNIEIKTKPEGDGILHPKPQEFVERLMKVIFQKNIQNRVIIQSFDPRALEIMHVKYPGIPLMLLTTRGTLQDNLKKLNFKPTYYCPSVKLINKAELEECDKLGIKLIGGNINNKKEIERILKLGISGFISDYPYNAK